MRTDQFIGLNPWATKLIEGVKGTPISSHDTAWSGPQMLHAFRVNGEVYEEYVQASPWSSGPMYFYALKKAGVPVEESLWTEDEIMFGGV